MPVRPLVRSSQVPLTFVAYRAGHRAASLFAGEGGYELVMVLGALGLVLAGTGPGRLSVDALLSRRRTSERELVSA